MPLKMRLATKGAARKLRTSISACFSGTLERACRQVDIVIEEFEVIGHLGNAAYRWQKHDGLAAYRVGDRVRRLGVEVRLDPDHLDILRLHLADQLERVARRGRNAGLGLDITGYFDSEAVGEVGPGLMDCLNCAGALGVHLLLHAL